MAEDTSTMEEMVTMVTDMKKAMTDLQTSVAQMAIHF